MAYIRTTIVTPDPRLFARSHNQAIRSANEESAAYHHDKNMPDHFKMVGYTKYRFDQRVASYRKRKQRKVNHQLPNVLTGTTRSEVLGARTIRATPKGARLLMRFSLKGGSGRFYVRRGMSFRQITSQVYMMRRVAELEAVTEGELKTLGGYRVEQYAKNVQRHIASGGKIRKRAKG